MNDQRRIGDELKCREAYGLSRSGLETSEAVRKAAARIAVSLRMLAGAAGQQREALHHDLLRCVFASCLLGSCPPFELIEVVAREFGLRRGAPPGSLRYRRRQPRHDDLVLTVAIAVWHDAERQRSRVRVLPLPF